MLRVMKVEHLEGFRLAVKFEDGVHGVIDLSGRLWGPMFEPLRDPEMFARASIDEFGVICWPNGADLAPDSIHAQLVEREGRGGKAGSGLAG